MTDMDVLVLGRQVLLKEQQPARPGPSDRGRHLERFERD
jgi:hypothetical protein